MIEHMISHPRCAVWAQPGSGKSSAVLHALNAADLLDEAPVLILGPKRVSVGVSREDQGVWVSEAAKWDGFDHRVVPIRGTQTERFQAMAQRANFFTANYEMLPFLVKHYGRNWPFKTIVADEATRLKSFRLRQGGQRTGALGKVAWLPQVERFIEITGTPSPNGLKDLYGQLWFLDKGERLGRTFDAFKQRFFTPSWDGYGIEPTAHAQEIIQNLIKDICITIDPRDYGLKLDEVIETEVLVDLPDKARDTYRKMERQMFVELEASGALHEIEAVNAAAKTNKLLQCANGFIYGEDKQPHPLHDAKLLALESIVEELNGMPVIVSTQFIEDTAMIKRAFPKARHFDEVSIKDFQAGRVPMLVLHPASAGHGVDGLQEGTNVWIDYSTGWNLEFDLQGIERIGPMRQYQSGLNRPVYRYRLIAKDTVDEMVRDRRSSKRSVQEILLEAMKRRG